MSRKLQETVSGLPIVPCVCCGILAPSTASMKLRKVMPDFAGCVICVHIRYMNRLAASHFIKALL